MTQQLKADLANLIEREGPTGVLLELSNVFDDLEYVYGQRADNHGAIQMNFVTGVLLALSQRLEL